LASGTFDLKLMQAHTLWLRASSYPNNNHYSPIFSDLPGGMDGTLLFWNIGAKGSDEPMTRVPYAVSQLETLWFCRKINPLWRWFPLSFLWLCNFIAWHGNLGPSGKTNFWRIEECDFSFVYIFFFGMWF
jgi:hypothetical protein